ncbi:hypothetical protein Glove_29g129 [Diversispora epigaea]|uniref:Ubiquitin-like domain-containing protein n=1 Tax=Diversispora epigaea TaxID=1348612 RepID=A0A397JHQ6_9GLOM|nr:hypothetical protein Glove_29g129 [Diversispora epigaea]
MKCIQCKQEKLAKEFPPSTITERCQHISSFCLKCLITQLKDQNKTQHKCPEFFTILTSQEVKALKLEWDKAPFKIGVNSIGKIQPIISDYGNIATGEFHVVMLNGQKTTLLLKENKTIIVLRSNIFKKLQVNQTKQKLIYNREELQDTFERRPRTLADYKIGPGCHIQLIVAYYNRCCNLKVCIFDLYWTYPANGPQDFLDGSCLLYAAKLDQLPQEVTQLYFVLSSQKLLSIGNFHALCFKLYEEAQPDKELCTYTIQQASNSQAVILSCVSRTGEGMWQVIQVGKLSSGNVNDYDPIKISIDECKLHGYID